MSTSEHPFEFQFVSFAPSAHANGRLQQVKSRSLATAVPNPSTITIPNAQIQQTETIIPVAQLEPAIYGETTPFETSIKLDTIAPSITLQSPRKRKKKSKDEDANKGNEHPVQTWSYAEREHLIGIMATRRQHLDGVKSAGGRALIWKDLVTEHQLTYPKRNLESIRNQWNFLCFKYKEKLKKGADYKFNHEASLTPILKEYPSIMEPDSQTDIMGRRLKRRTEKTSGDQHGSLTNDVEQSVPPEKKRKDDSVDAIVKVIRDIEKNRVKERREDRALQDRLLKMQEQTLAILADLVETLKKQNSGLQHAS
ncbi:hypothetical protein BC938DRAFT_484301 [Jimgerdemannia flammicorona]|uniref:Uncharacterized protein n=1 Tax=Jimgerdemannia flammicorona TaxID=994334 RepID=A0A433QA43_9FUNG|nr:hypothetical protein BC938DRAFT_484301 [Jimgerdemannia flammicorona]